MPEAKQFVAFVAVLTTLLLIFGSPIGSGDNYRTRWAFQQHFSLNWVEWTQDKTLNPWTECDKISKKNFGEIDSIQQAALNNPSIFMKHIVTNILNYPSTLAYSLAHTSINKTGPRYSLIEISFFILLLVIYAFSLILHQQRARMDTKSKRAVALLCVFFIPSVISTILIYPRPHYVTLHIVVAILLLSLVFLRIQSAPWKSKLSTALLSGVLVLVITPSPYMDTTEKVIKKSPHKVQKAVKCIQDLGIKKEVNLLGAHGGLHVYIGSNYSRVRRDEKKAPFFQFLTKNKINMIFLIKSLVSDSRFSSDPEWKMFITDPKKYGFNVINAKEIIGGYLLVHTSLTSKQSLP
jgi:hypothetical protein